MGILLSQLSQTTINRDSGYTDVARPAGSRSAGVRGTFSDWAAMTTSCESCIGMK
jgi:hypothetical protein